MDNIFSGRVKQKIIRLGKRRLYIKVDNPQFIDALLFVQNHYKNIEINGTSPKRAKPRVGEDKNG